MNLPITYLYKLSCGYKGAEEASLKNAVVVSGHDRNFMDEVARHAHIRDDGLHSSEEIFYLVAGTC